MTIPPHILAMLVAATRDPAYPIHFTPVRLRTRRDGWTEQRQRLYLAALAATGHGGRAAAIAGISAQSVAALHRRPDAGSFSRAVTAAYRWFKILDAAGRARVAEVSNRPGNFSLRGSEPLTPYETSGGAGSGVPRRSDESLTQGAAPRRLPPAESVAGAEKPT